MNQNLSFVDAKLSRKTLASKKITTFLLLLFGHTRLFRTQQENRQKCCPKRANF